MFSFELMNLDRREDFEVLGADISTLRHVVLAQAKAATGALGFPKLGTRCIIFFDDTIASPFVAVMVYFPYAMLTVRHTESIASLHDPLKFRADVSVSIRQHFSNLSQAIRDEYTYLVSGV